MLKEILGKKCIFRGDRSGVFFGELAYQENRIVCINNCRRLWRWEGANSISELALNGTSRPNDCKFTVVVANITLTDCIEIIPCTEKAINNIESVKIWKY